MYSRLFRFTHLSVLLFLLHLCGLISCGEAPPSLPSDLESLLSYVFEHAADEDPEALAQGIVELHTWFQDEEKLRAAREGFIIENLSAEALKSLIPFEESSSPRSNENLKGVHVVTKSPYCVKQITGLLTWDQFGELLTNLDSYKRTFDQPSSCMVERDCLQVDAESETSSRWAGLVAMTSRYSIQYRWVYTQVGWALVHRFWLKSPAVGDRFDVKMNANYYVGVTLPDATRVVTPPSPSFLRNASGVSGRSGLDIAQLQETLAKPGSLRIHANWFDVDTGTIPLSEEMIANTLVQNQKNDSESHDDMINETPNVPGECNIAEVNSLSESTEDAP